MNSSNTPSESHVLELSATTYRSGSKATLVIGVVAGIGVTIVAQLGLVAAPEYAAYLPFASVPIILAMFVPLFLSQGGRSTKLRFDGGTVTVTSRRSVWAGVVARAQLSPWIVPGLGTSQGAILQLHARGRDGRSKVFALAASGVPVADEAHAEERRVQPEFFVQASDLQRLIGHFSAQGDAHLAASAAPSAQNRFVLVRRPGFREALGSMLPWLGTMAVLGVAGVLLGERLASHPTAMLGFGFFGLLAVGFGLWKTIQRSRTPKPRFELIVERTQTRINAVDGTVLWRCDGLPPLQRETYVYRTRYSTHRFAMIALGSGEHKLRVAVWDPRFARAGDPKGPAPNFLVGVPDWPRLERLLEAGPL